MGHQRFRKFNTKDMYPDQTIDNDMCMIVRSGRHVFLRGQTGFDLAGDFVGAGDAAAQTDQAMKNFGVLLEEAGATRAAMCKLPTDITARASRDPVYTTIGRHLKGVFPCGTGLIVNGLALPEMMMEIDVDAMIPEDRA